MNHNCLVESEVKDSRPSNGKVWRRRRCLKCSKRFTTYEITKSELEDLQKMIKLLIKQEGLKQRKENVEQEIKELKDKFNEASGYGDYI